jgi:hypothetical protein
MINSKKVRNIKLFTDNLFIGFLFALITSEISVELDNDFYVNNNYCPFVNWYAVYYAISYVKYLITLI